MGSQDGEVSAAAPGRQQALRKGLLLFRDLNVLLLVSSLVASLLSGNVSISGYRCCRHPVPMPGPSPTHTHTHILTHTPADPTLNLAVPLHAKASCESCVQACLGVPLTNPTD